MSGSYIAIGIVTVFIATFALFYIFDNLAKLSEQCKSSNPPSACRYFNSLTISMFVVLLIIGGFVMVVTAVAYIMISSSSQA